MKFFAVLSILALTGCTAQSFAMLQTEGSGEVTTPSVIPGPDGLHIRDADGAWSFIGMPEPNPPSFSLAGGKNV